MSTPTISVKLFGGFELRRADGVPIALTSRTARSLLAYLIVNRDRAQTRERLTGVFWPDQPEPAARRRLSQTLWKIGEALSGWLEADSLAVRVHPDWNAQVDLTAFEQVFVRGTPETTDAALMQSALDAYRGEFMAGYADDWVLEAREQFHNAFLNGLERWMRGAEAMGDFERALELSRRVVALEPLREAAHREVMRLCLILGRVREAVEQYERCRKTLLDELGEEPSAPTKALYQRIQLGESTAPERAPLELGKAVPLVGREAERAALLESLEGARRGVGSVVLLEAEPGLGKTRLLTEIAQDAAWRGFEVRHGHGQEWGGLEPYAAVREVLSTDLTPLRVELLSERVDAVWLREVGRVVKAFERPSTSIGVGIGVGAGPTVATLPPEHEGSRLREAITKTVTALAGIAPQLIVLDDLQWLDEASLEWLASLSRIVHNASVLIVVGYRPSEARERVSVWQTLEALDREGGKRLRLEPLPAADISLLVRRALGTTTATPLEARLQAEGLGNPLFVLETLRAVIEQGGIARAGQGAAALPLPGSVREVMVSRLTRLEPSIRTVLDAAAVIGTDLDGDLCAATSGLSRVATLEALDALVRRGFLAQTDTSLRFSHDRLRQIVYAELPEPDRRTLHTAVGRALEQSGTDDAALLARHFDAGGVWDRALEFHRQAAENARRVYAYTAALEHLDRALTLGEQTGLPNETRFDLLKQRVGALNVLGRRAEQFRDLEHMLVLAGNDPARLTDVKRRQANTLATIGNFDQARALAEEVVTEALAQGDRRQQAEALSILAMLAMRSGRREEAVPIRREIVEIYRELGLPAREAEALRLLGNSLMLLQQLDEAYEQTRKGLYLIKHLDDRLELARLVGSLGHIWRFRGKFARAAACYGFDLSLAQTTGNRSGEASSLINLAQVMGQLERTAEAITNYARAIEVFQAINDPEGEASARYNLAGVLVNQVGDFQSATEHLSIARGFYQRVNDGNGLAYCLVIETSILLEQGNLRQARAILESEALQTQGQRNRWLGVQAEVILAQVEIEEGQPDRALARLERLEALCRSIGLDALIERIVAVRSEALWTSGQPEAALALIEGLLESPDEQPGFELHFRHFKVLTALGQHDDARIAINRAYQSLLEALSDLSEDQRRMSLQRISAHRNIIQTWESLNLKLKTARLPRVGTPTGRALRDDEYVDVTWTLFAPEDNTAQDKTERRQRQLARLLDQARDQGAAPTVDDLARALGTSRATIKRDLTALRQSGSRVQTRGTRASGVPEAASSSRAEVILKP